ncbi:MAG: hypothetical protein HY842_05985 [Bacteroidetes bacterium]|nr:hypothetical protein [Bacteroidota bacterium]
MKAERNRRVSPMKFFLMLKSLILKNAVWETPAPSNGCKGSKKTGPHLSLRRHFRFAEKGKSLLLRRLSDTHFSKRAGGFSTAFISKK